MSKYKFTFKGYTYPMWYNNVAVFTPVAVASLDQIQLIFRGRKSTKKIGVHYESHFMLKPKRDKLHRVSYDSEYEGQATQTHSIYYAMYGLLNRAEEEDPLYIYDLLYRRRGRLKKFRYNWLKIVYRNLGYELIR